MHYLRGFAPRVAPALGSWSRVMADRLRQQGRRHATSSATRRDGLAMSAQDGDDEPTHHLLQSVLGGILDRYWESSPTAEAAVDMLEAELPEAPILFDHFAFRTFGVGRLGISSCSSLFTDFGYIKKGELTFPTKKLRAEWFSPPHWALPRVFISELLVSELSAEAQAAIARYTSADADLLGRYGLISSLLGTHPWPTPSLEDFELLVKESEYAAWVLVNGYALNHTTVSVHGLEGLEGGIAAVNALLKAKGFTLNAAGGEIKRSDDGMLLQSSTMADLVSFNFAEGETRSVPGAYMEFAERLVLSEFRHFKTEDVREWHRRDGFESASADKIFESTSLAAGERSRGAAGGDQGLL